jgi:hypothetical protein
MQYFLAHLHQSIGKVCALKDAGGLWNTSVITVVLHIDMVLVRYPE